MDESAGSKSARDTLGRGTRTAIPPWRKAPALVPAYLSLHPRRNAFGPELNRSGGDRHPKVGLAYIPNLL